MCNIICYVIRNVMFITAAVPRNCPVTFSCPSTCLTGYTSGSDGCPLCVCVGQQGKAFMAVLFDLILYVPSTIFQLKRDGSSLVEPVLR